MMTALDLQEIGIRYLGGDVNDTAIRDVRHAARMAIQELAKEHAWPCYITYRKMTLQAPYDTGTIAFNVTTRQFTLSGGTWPTWAVYGVIKVGSAMARVLTRDSATVLTIEADSEFTATLAAGTAFTLYQDEYPLDTPFHKMSRAFVDRNKYGMEYRDPANFVKVKRPNLVAGTNPRFYTVYRDRNVPGGLVMAFYPNPTVTRTVSFSAIRFPADILVWDEHTGRVAVTGASLAVAGTATLFDVNDHPGCILRISRNTEIPTSKDGDTPYDQERLIASVADATNLTTATAWTTTRSNVGLAISSQVDINERSMQAVLVQRLFLELSRVRTLKDANVQVIAATYAKMLSDAKSSAQPDMSITHAGDFASLGGFSSTEFYTIGA